MPTELLAPVLAVRVPGLPQPKGSPRPLRAGRKTILTVSTAKGLPWERAVALAVRLAWAPRPPLQGPVAVDLVFYLPRPKSARKRPLPSVKPDGDKLERAVWDSLVRGGAIGDDSQITSWQGRKRYAVDAFIGVAIALRPDEVP